MCPNCTTMRCLLLSSLLALGLTVSAQIPDYVPTDGLLAFYPLDGNAQDLGGGEFDGSLSGVEFEQSECNGGQHLVNMGNGVVNLPTEVVEFSEELTIAYRFRLNTNDDATMFRRGVGGEMHSVYNQFNDDNLYFSMKFATNSWHMASVALPSIGDWYSVVATYSAVEDSIKIFLNTGDSGAEPTPDAGLWNYNIPTQISRHIDGDVDDFALWNRILTAEEREVYLKTCTVCADENACNFNETGVCLYLNSCGECGGFEGCTDVNACNYNPEATCDNGGCVIDNGFELPEDILTCQDEIELVVPSYYPNILWSHGENTAVVSVSESGTYSVQTAVEGTTNHIYSGSQTIDISGSSTVTSNESFSVSFDLKLDSVPAFDGGDPNHDVIDQGPGGQWMIHWAEENQTLRFQVNSNTWYHVDSPVELGEWVHLLCVYSAEDETIEIWADGVLIDSQEAPNSLYNWNGYPGLKVNRNANWNFNLDNLHVLSGAQDGASFDAKCSSAVGPSSLLFYDFDVLEGGVMSDLSGNGLDASTEGDFPVEIYPGACPTWGECVFTDSVDVQFLDCTALDGIQGMCGPGTSWDSSSGACVINNPSDTDFDGCVSMTDLLDLLSVFGTCNETPWTCGDPLEYQGHAYETVQIGDQCWFAENCRFMPFVGGGFQEEPSILVYGYDGDSVEEAQETLTYDMYGALYNFASATQLGLCPQGWHVPSKIEFDELFANLGGIDQAHFQVMQEQAWNVDFDIADEGFSLLPAGWLYLSFAQVGESAYMWTSTPYGENDPRGYAWNIQELNQFQVVYEGASRSAGQSVRCIKDSE